MNINLEKRFLVVGLAVMILLAVIVYAATLDKSGKWHDDSAILVTIDGFTMNLQEAINGNYLVAGVAPPTSDGTTSASVSHGAGEIWVYAEGGSRTLQDAINNDALCPATSGTPVCGSTPCHLSTQIDVGGGQSLQDLIDNGDFCCVPDCSGKECGDDGCGGTCGTCGSGETCSGGVCVSSSVDCTSSATFGSGVTQFTVQPTGTDGDIKTGTCDNTPFCDGLPTAKCNSGTWIEQNNTCRAANLVWEGYGTFVGQPDSCSNYPDCTESQVEGEACTTFGDACAKTCILTIGRVLKCVDSACDLVDGMPTCPPCTTNLQWGLSFWGPCIYFAEGFPLCSDLIGGSCSTFGEEKPCRGSGSSCDYGWYETGNLFCG
jgi:hypothetical protein